MLTIMRKAILQFVKATALIAGFSTFMNSAYSQQSIIAGKDDTHPELTTQLSISTKIYSISAKQMTGYNEIQWSAVDERDTRRFIVEYSTDGINYLGAGELLPFKGVYKLKHYMLDSRALLYRIRMEKKDGRSFNSAVFLLDGIDISPVKIYPTIVTGSMLNMQMSLPVQKLNIVNSSGQQILAKEMDGLMGTTQLAIPPLSKGQYLLTFYGNGWQRKEKFMIGGQ